MVSQLIERLRTLLRRPPDYGVHHSPPPRPRPGMTEGGPRGHIQR